MQKVHTNLYKASETVVDVSMVSILDTGVNVISPQLVQWYRIPLFDIRELTLHHNVIRNLEKKNAVKS